MKLDPRKIAQELLRREKALETAKDFTASIKRELFDKQLNFIEDPSRNKAAICTRRAGKTMMWPRYCFIVALENPKSLIRVWGITRLRTKQLLWQEFIDAAHRHKIAIKAHETELSIRLDNGSEIRLVGADKDQSAQRKRGDKTTLEVILEAQLFGPFLRTLVEDVVEPCLFDTQGTMCLEGTPHPVPTGYWYNVTGGNDTAHDWVSEGMLISTGAEQEKELVGAGWSCHHWTQLDNPHLPHAKAELERLRKKRNWTLDTPTYVREYLGRWVRDEGVLFYKYNEGRNSFTLTEVVPWGPGWKHVLGWDLGSKDDMALVAWGWHPSRRELFEAGSWKKPGALAEEVMQQIANWEKLGFNFIAKVADTGGGGRMYVEDVMSRYSQVFEKASKTDKLDHVRMMNDDFQSATIKVQRGSLLATEYSALPKDPDWDPDSGKPPGEDPRFPNHCCFIAGTLIHTARGQIPIESVTTSDQVLTRAGWRQVLKHAPTGEKEVISRLGLTGTPDHPIWTENAGWRRLDSILDTDVVLYSWNSLESLSGEGFTGTDIQIRSGGRIGFTTNEPTRQVDLSGYIEPSTQNNTDRYQRDITSIMSMRTRSIMSPAICNSLMEQHILDNTRLSAGKKTQNSTLRVSKKHVSRPPSGTGPLREELGIASTLDNLWQGDHFTPVTVSFVEHLLSLKQKVRRSAATSVTQNVDETAESITRSESVEIVEKTLSSTSTQNKKTAVVYTLTVEGQHEYFANGALVSNCDAALYSWRKALSYLDFEPVVAEESDAERVEREDEERLSRVSEHEDWWEADFPELDALND